MGNAGSKKKGSVEQQKNAKKEPAVVDGIDNLSLGTDDDSSSAGDSGASSAAGVGGGDGARLSRSIGGSSSSSCEPAEASGKRVPRIEQQLITQCLCVEGMSSYVLCFAPANNDVLCCGLFDGFLAFVSLETAKVVKPPMHLGPKIWMCKRHGDHIYAASSTGSITQIDAETLEAVHTFPAPHEHTPYDVCMIDPPRNIMMTVGSENTCLVRNVGPRSQHSGDPDDVDTAAAADVELVGGRGYCLLPWGDHIYVGCQGDGAILQLSRNAPYGRVKRIDGHTKSVRCLVRTEGGLLASGSFDYSIKIWDPRQDHKCVKTIEEHTKAVRALATMGWVLISGSSDNSIRVWSLHTYECLQKLDEGNVVNCFAWWGSRLLVGDDANKVKAWTGFTVLPEYGGQLPRITSLLLCYKAGADDLVNVPKDIIKLLIDWIRAEPWLDAPPSEEVLSDSV